RRSGRHPLCAGRLWPRLAARRHRGVRDAADHPPPRVAALRLEPRAQARLRRRRGRRRADRRVAAHAGDRRRHPAHVARAGALSAGAHGPRRPALRHAEVPLDGAGRGGDDRASVGGAERPTSHRVRRVPAAGQSRRAAAAVQCAARRDEPGRPSARAAVVRGRLSASCAALHAAAQGEGRDHRLGADQRLAGQHLDREAHRVRPLLHRALVPRLRHQDPAADRLARLPQPERLLTAVLATLRGALPTERLDHARVVAALLVVLAAGLAFSITLSETTLVVLAALLIVSGSADALRRAPLTGPIVAFAAWTLVAAALSAEPADSLRATRSLLPLATMWIVLAALPSSAAARRFATALFVAVAAAALTAIVQVVTCPADGGYGSGPHIPVVGGFFRKCARAHA